VGSDGLIRDHIVYNSFGLIQSQTNPSVTPRFAYTGREYDPETGLQYYRSRYYDPATGRFLSEDRAGFAAGDPNLYRYVDNDPTNATDPTGNVIFTTIGAAVGGAAGALIGGFTGRHGRHFFDWRRAKAGAASGALIGAGIGLAADTFGAGSALSSAL